ncbi:protein NETWORKED 2A [Cajanus cajan]|uniref:protein NETWORKED 2A n=1 Tax=Cajanus cajan TaxID=3821 RepID=UPI0010FAE494|nr:protein NETWORKED 2A [Cajanus cajan]
MLRRAATNAYSWWWASHIRTKQSKWLEQSLQDMEEVVAETLKIIHDEGESFSQRAEMYYRKRPQLVGYVEEVFRAYRALAERYDLLSKELQSANRTIASAFPEQVHYRIDEDDGEEGFHGTNSSSQHPNNQTPKSSIPKAPNMPKKDFRSPSMVLSKKGTFKRFAKSAPTSPHSGLSKVAALAEVDKLQKEMLALQTEKEFVKCLYEHSYEKHWEIEDRITEMQKRVYSLQDEFDINAIIEDNEARALMASTALNSCKESLAKLQGVQVQSSEEAKVAHQRVKEAHAKYEALKDQFISKHKSQQDHGIEPKNIEEEDLSNLEEEMHEHDVGKLRDMIKKKLEEDSGSSLTMTEIVEKIDELVSKVVTLETEVSSQTGLVKRLRLEADELQKNILSLEEGKEMLIEDSEETKKKLKEVEEELRRVKILNENIKRKGNNHQTHFTEASCDLEHLLGKMNDVKLEEEGENSLLYKNQSAPDEELEESEKPGDNTKIMKDVNITKENKEDRSVYIGDVRNEDNRSNLKENIDFRNEEEFEKPGDNTEIMKDVKITKEGKKDHSVNIGDDSNEDNKPNLKETIDFRTEEIPEPMVQEKDDLSEVRSNVETESLDLGTGEKEDQPTWNDMSTSGLDETEKILLEYTSVLRSYEDVKGKLNDVEKKNRDNISELTHQVRELKDTVEIKDKEINILQQKLSCSETNPDESHYTTLTDYNHTPQEALLQGIDSQDPENPSSNTDASAVSTSYANQQHVENKEKVGISMSHGKTILVKVKTNQLGKSHSLSNLEKKFRSDIDDLLEENLEFWLRFSTSVHQIQKFQNSIKDLRFELRKIRGNNMPQENSSSIQSEIKPIFRHLREIRTELLLWLEHNEVLQEELQGRHPSLCTLQDEIARAANPNCASHMAELSGYQAAKFQGEVLNMKQESNKVSSELEAGVSCVKGLRGQVEKMLEELNQEIRANTHGNMKHSTSRGRIPLKSFLFGIKLKKQKQTVLTCVHPTLLRQYSDLSEAEDTFI